MLIIPAILENNEKEFEKKFKILRKYFRRYHIDIIDKSYRNLTLGIRDLQRFEEKLFIEAHLMIQNPEESLEKIKDKEIDLIIAQIEDIKNINNYCLGLEKLKLKKGLAINLKTKIQDCEKEIIKVDSLLLMAVEAGKAGQKFDYKVLEKIKQARRIIGNNAEIIVDGGVNLKTAMLCKKAGVDGVLVNSFLWEDFENNLYELKKLEH